MAVEVEEADESRMDESGRIEEAEDEAIVAAMVLRLKKPERRWRKTGRCARRMKQVQEGNAALSGCGHGVWSGAAR